MTVGEMKNNLSFFNDEDEVFLAYPSGDYWGTVCATEVTTVGAETVVESEYHRAYKVANPDREYEESETKQVVLIQ